jgi:S-adenosylmethionine:tRNA ribosyltransferase-isomerase
MRTADFDYDLPAELIAQTPLEPRHASRLLVVDRRSQEQTETTFWELGRFLHADDLLVINETRVIPARLFARKIPSGGRGELLLLRRLPGGEWEVLAGGKGLAPGRRLQVENGPEAEIIADLGGARRLARFSQPVEAYLRAAGHIPLPPYIKAPLPDPERYQTVYNRQEGSAAAPTAGLHFTPELMARLEAQGVRFAPVVLHIGLDTFAPVLEDDPRQHHIHTEWCLVPEQTASLIGETRRRGGRVIAVGTTTVRTLETAARQAGVNGSLPAFEGPTALYILPGFEFCAVDAMITNFHLPRSTLLMLVSAFAGAELIREAYQAAVAQRFRFYSFGDAMLIV